MSTSTSSAAPEQISFQFDALQREMELQIDERLKLTRQKLLEHFDDEVQEKLRIKNKEGLEVRSRYDEWLWQVTRYYLAPYADFDEHDHSFTLRTNPFPGEVIHPGPYRSGRDVQDANLYRLGHPLARRLIEECRRLAPAKKELRFQYSGSGRKIAIVDSLIGRGGILQVVSFSVTALEQEDHLLFAALADDGSAVDAEQCRRLFTLMAAEVELVAPINGQAAERLHRQLEGRKQEVLNALSQRNATYFDEESEKLEKWADDLKAAIELELKELDLEIKSIKREAKLEAKLGNKLQLHRKAKEVETHRAKKRRELFVAQDEIDVRKETLISEVEARLQQRAETEDLFTIRWRLD